MPKRSWSSLVARVSVVASFAALPVVGLFWPNLAAAMSAAPGAATSGLVDALLCFGPLALPLLGVGGVVVWAEQSG